MPTRPLTLAEAQAAVDVVAKWGSQAAASRQTGVARTTLQNRIYQYPDLLRAAGLEAVSPQGQLPLGPEPVGRVRALQRDLWPIPKKGRVNRYIFTCAQNNTKLHTSAWENMRALAAHYGARICVSTFTYRVDEMHTRDAKPGTAKAAGEERDWWAPEVLEHLCNESVEVAPGLVWAGNLQILPTAVRPLSSLEAYTGRKSAIVPHVKFAMESIASGKYEGTKFNFTTGTITQRNYIQKKAGQKAEFHHGYGGLIVEVDSDGDWFVRQLNADSDGTIYDLDLRAKAGKVVRGHRVEAISWGDIHVGTVPPEVMAMQWTGKDSIIDVLCPRCQFMHDTLDFRSRNHHDMKNFHRMYTKYRSGDDDVLAELQAVARFLTDDSQRDWCQTVVVDSNHDNALGRWLREADYKQDLKNARFFLEAQLAMVAAIDANDKDFHLLEWCVRRLAGAEDIKFLRQDESFIICPDANGGIENGMHGDLGPNGARGNINGFARMGRKSSVGHGHGAGIRDGAWMSGITGDLDQGYNVGPSNWSRSHIVTQPNGKRQMVTCWKDKWRAQ